MKKGIRAERQKLMDLNHILFILVMMFGVFVQALAGFGGTLLSMPLCIMLVGLPLSKPVLTIVAWITGMSSLVTQYKYIIWRELAKMVGVMLLGVLGGLWATGRIRLDFLLIIYAVIVIAIGVRKLFFPQKKEVSVPVRNAALAVAGIMQGLFVSGGSFLAVYAVAQIKEKREFRATVNAVWGILNLVMIITYITGGLMTREVLTMSGIAIIPTVIAIWLGNLLSKHIRQSTFLKIIYIVLIVSGIVLLISNL